MTLLVFLLQGCLFYPCGGGPFSGSPECIGEPLVPGTFDGADLRDDQTPDTVVDIGDDDDMTVTFEDADGNLWEARYTLTPSELPLR